MTDIQEIQGQVEGAGLRFAVVASRFNRQLCDGLVDSAVECLLSHGVADADLSVVRVPGAFEIPLVLEELATAGEVDGLVALGVVIRGDTPHFDYVCSEASRGCSRVALEHRMPIGFGLLTCDTLEQAAARVGGRSQGDPGKGWEAALAALEIAGLLRHLRGGGSPGAHARRES